MAYIGKQPVVGNFVKLDAIVTSATATYNLLNGGVAYFPQTANNCIVSLNGVIQSPTSAYTISGSTIIFDSALTSADSIDFILVLGDVLAIGTPSDSTVGFAKVTSNLITGATAVTTPATDDVLLCYDTSATDLKKITFANFGNAPAFSVYRNANQSVAHNTDVKIQFDVENFDTNNAFDSTTNYRFTVPTGYGGKYFFTAFVGYAALQDQNEAQIRFKKNGSDMNVFVNFQGNNGFVVLCATTVETLSAGDYVEVFANQKAGVTEDIQGGELYTSFKGFRLIGV